MLPTTRPSPGKCLATDATPAEAIPSMNATPCSPLACGSDPNSRSSCPIGAFVDAVPAGTVSITGARLRLTPAACSWLPQIDAWLRSALVVQLPWTSADGITSNPGPVSCWISPPSWLAPMRKRTSSVSACASAWMAAVAAASEAVPSAFSGSRMDPKWYFERAVCVPDPAMSVVGATRKSWPTRCASVSWP